MGLGRRGLSENIKWHTPTCTTILLSRGWNSSLWEVRLDQGFPSKSPVIYCKILKNYYALRLLRLFQRPLLRDLFVHGKFRFAYSWKAIKKMFFFCIILRASISLQAPIFRGVIFCYEFEGLYMEVLIFSILWYTNLSIIFAYLPFLCLAMTDSPEWIME